MKKLLFPLALIVSITGYSQTTIYSEDFESAGHSFTLNTTDVFSTTTGFNPWLVNNSFTGGSGSLTCLGFPFSYSVGNVNTQPAGITNSPNSKYMHITSQEAINDGIFCASYLPSDGTCFFDEYNFSKMTADVTTTGMTGITFDFWWLCGGASGTTYGEVYYSLDGGSNWILEQSNLNNTTTWTQTSLTNAAWDNQTTLRFGFRFVNIVATAGLDPGFGVDDITIIQNCTATNSTISETVCDSYTSPSGNYIWTSSNTYMDTIPNAANCDSIITVNLTINNSSSSTITETACDSYTSPSGNYIWTSSNTYMDTIPNAANCDSIITINLTINNVDSSVNQAGSLLTANETGVNYQWLNCPGMTPISGDTNQSYTATVNGGFAVIVTNNGCSDTSACYTVTGVGIIENDFGNGLILYPNPTDGNFSIDLGGNYQTVNITITDLSGKVIKSNIYSESQLLNLNIEEPTGVYLLMIESGDKKAVIRLVKE